MKVKVQSKLVSPDGITTQHTIGILQENKLQYNEENAKVSITFDDSCLSLKRVGKDFEMILVFAPYEATEGKYQVLDIGSIFHLTIETTNYIVKENYVEIFYQMKMNQEMVGSFELYVTYGGDES